MVSFRAGRSKRGHSPPPCIWSPHPPPGHRPGFSEGLGPKEVVGGGAKDSRRGLERNYKFVNLYNASLQVTTAVTLYKNMEVGHGHLENVKGKMTRA